MKYMVSSVMVTLKRTDIENLLHWYEAMRLGEGGRPPHPWDLETAKNLARAIGRRKVEGEWICRMPTIADPTEDEIHNHLETILKDFEVQNGIKFRTKILEWDRNEPNKN